MGSAWTDSDWIFDEARLPYLTADIAPVGGIIKRYNEDFVVEEIPRYAASGDGTHLYVTIEKSGMTTLQANSRIARAIGKKPRDIGYAGMKDAHGVTRQRISVEHVSEERIRAIEERNIRVLKIERHSNKIKLGHLAGNRFELKLRECRKDGLEDAKRVMETLARRGAPNYFGSQRFGNRGDNALVGALAVRGELREAISIMLGGPQPGERDDVRRARELFDRGAYAEAADAWPRQLNAQARVTRAFAKRESAKDAWRAVDHTLRKLFLSAAQSAVFNEVVVRRFPDLDRVLAGDVAWKHENGASFVVEDVAAEQPRCEAFEISPTGPLPGSKMKAPSGEPAEIEEAVLRDGGLELGDAKSADAGSLPGARRPLRVPLGEPVCDAGKDDRGPFIRLAFSLPAGAYATNVSREVCKNPTQR